MFLKREKTLVCAGSRTRFLSWPARSAVRMLNELSWLDYNLEYPGYKLRVTATGPRLLCAYTKCYAVDSYVLENYLCTNFCADLERN